MMSKRLTRKQRRFALIGACGLILSLAAALILSALSGSIAYFRSPSDISELGLKPGTRFRLGGLVETGSLLKSGEHAISFLVTDGNHDLKVTYDGLLPDLFREGQGVVAEGVLQPDGLFRADTVLAKHDEKYMPREVVDALKKQGRWQEGAAAPLAAAKPVDKPADRQP
jgi:cytochrome c-type biogenesis protein CcmE